MNGFTRTPWRKPAFRLLGTGLIAIGAGLCGPGLLEASAIRRAHDASEADLARAAHEDSVAHPGIFRSWSKYLMGGPSVWSTHIHPPVTPAVESAIWHAIKTDPGEASPWIQFLLYKQNLDQARFDHFHPNISRALEKLSAPHTGAQVTGTPPSTAPSTGSGSSPIQSQQLGPNPVPEPGSSLIAIGLSGWVLWWRRYSRRTAQR